MKLLHLSDLHFHTSQDGNRKANSLLKTVAKRFPNHYYIVTGDITDDGAEKQYENARAALEPLVPRVFICPGNHDFGAAGNFYSLERARRFDSMLSVPLQQSGTFAEDATPVTTILSDGDVEAMLIALDTNLETYQSFDFACGQVGETQLAALETILTIPPTTPLAKILFCHHHPFMVNNPFMELMDAREFMRTIYGRVDVLLFGHKHESRAWQNCNGISHVLASDNSPGKSLAREIILTKSKVTVKDVMIK